MDCPNQLPVIDMLTFITDELLQTYRSTNDEQEKVGAITEFLRRLIEDNSIAKLKSLNVEFESGKNKILKLKDFYNLNSVIFRFRLV